MSGHRVLAGSADPERDVRALFDILQLHLTDPAFRDGARDGRDRRSRSTLVTDGGDDVDDTDADDTETDRWGRTLIPDPETAVVEGVLIAVGEGDSETVREILDDLEAHRRGTWARVELLLPTAMLERILLEVEDSSDQTVADWIRRMIWVWIGEIDLNAAREKMVQVDVPVSGDVWERSRLAAAASCQLGKDPEMAFYDTLMDAVPTARNYVPAGSQPGDGVLGPDDLPIDREGEDGSEE